MPVRRCRGAVGEPAPSRNGSALGREGGNERAREEGAAAPRLGPTSCQAGRRGPAPASPAARRERRLLAAEPSRAVPSQAAPWLPGWALAGPVRRARPGSGYGAAAAAANAGPPGAFERQVQRDGAAPSLPPSARPPPAPPCPAVPCPPRPSCLAAAPPPRSFHPAFFLFSFFLFSYFFRWVSSVFLKEKVPERAPSRERVGLDRQENAPAGRPGEAAPKWPRSRSAEARGGTRAAGGRLGMRAERDLPEHLRCCRPRQGLCHPRLSALLPLGWPPLSAGPFCLGRLKELAPASLPPLCSWERQIPLYLSGAGGNGPEVADSPYSLVKPSQVLVLTVRRLGFQPQFLHTSDRTKKRAWKVHEVNFLGNMWVIFLYLCITSPEFQSNALFLGL